MKAGRGGDPSEFWAKGEIGFFDFYIIPLAKKLKECGVFGVSSCKYAVTVATYLSESINPYAPHAQTTSIFIHDYVPTAVEYLNYAIQNRDEWAEKGEAITKQLKEDADRIWEERGDAILADMREKVSTRSYKSATGDNATQKAMGVQSQRQLGHVKASTPKTKTEIEVWAGGPVFQFRKHIYTLVITYILGIIVIS